MAMNETWLLAYKILGNMIDNIKVKTEVVKVILALFQ